MCKVFASIAVLVFIGVAANTIRLRVRLGRLQREALDKMDKDPMGFLISAVNMPESVSPLGLDEDATDAQSAIDAGKHASDAEFAALFLKVYGRWSKSLGVAAARHCGSREFGLMAAGHKDVMCGDMKPACRAGFYADEMGQARPVPSGAFSLDGQSCVVVCARGAQCNASALQKNGLCEYPEGGTTVEDVDLKACPGRKHMTLCPAGFSCANPLDVVECPAGSYCPRGTDVPLPCGFLSSCDQTGLERPVYYYRSCFVALAALVVALWRPNPDVSFDVWWRLRSRRRRICGRCWSRCGFFRDFSRRDFFERFSAGPPPKSVIRVSVSYEGLRLVLRNGSVAVDDASGSCRPGRVTACLGPSGSGKSSLLQLLAGTTPAGGRVSGVVKYNGVTLRRPSLLTGFVPQMDSGLPSYLTVAETLGFYAAIRGHARDRALAVANDLGLEDLLAATVGTGGLGVDRGLSGGERKRLSVALELAHDPPVVFADEPTSGLCVTTGLAVVAALRGAADRGACVFCVLHQPSPRIWGCVDDCVVVATRGRVVYSGPAMAEASPGVALPDFSVYFQGRQCQRYCEEENADTLAARALSLEKACTERAATSWSWQFALFAARCVLDVGRHGHHLFYDVVVQLAAGSLLGALYPRFGLRESQQVGFVVQLSLGFAIALSSARLFADRDLAFRELAKAAGMGLQPSAFFLAKILVIDVPHLALLVLAFLVAWYPEAAPQNAILVYYLPCFAAAFAAAGAAHLLNVAQDTKTAQLSTVAFLVASAVCSGVAPTLPDLERRLGPRLAKAFAWTSYSRWLVEALFSCDIANLTTAFRYPPPVYGHPRDESAILGLLAYAYDAHSENLNAVIVIGIGLLLRLAAFFALHATTRDVTNVPPSSRTLNVHADDGGGTSLLGRATNTFSSYSRRHQQTCRAPALFPRLHFLRSRQRNQTSPSRRPLAAAVSSSPLRYYEAVDQNTSADDAAVVVEDSATSCV